MRILVIHTYREWKKDRQTERERERERERARGILTHINTQIGWYKRIDLCVCVCVCVCVDDRQPARQIDR